ncbi:hypothetical protein ACLI4Q_06065 [Natrialbaceae archaeon A-CW1-1]
MISGIGVYVVRSEIPYLTFESGLREFQFSLVYILLGLLPILFKRSGGAEGRAVSLFLSVSIVIGLWIQPQLDLINLVIVLLVMFGGFTYYGVYSGASNRELLGIISIIIFEWYLFTLYYMWLSFQETGDIRLTVLTVIYLTGAVLVLKKLLWAEYQKAIAGTGWTP